MLSQKQEIILGELISRKVKITKSNCKDLQGKTGTITNETTNTIQIKTNTKTITAPKTTCTFEINKTTINGKLLISKPQDRTKNLSRKKTLLKNNT